MRIDNSKIVVIIGFPAILRKSFSTGYIRRLFRRRRFYGLGTINQWEYYWMEQWQLWIWITSYRNRLLDRVDMELVNLDHGQ